MSVPPLPDVITLTPDTNPGELPAGITPNQLEGFPQFPFPPFPPIFSLQQGSWLLNYTPTATFLTTYDGTLRVEDKGGNQRIGSGDLYLRPWSWVRFPLPPSFVLGPPPNPANGIPSLAINTYSHYLSVTKLTGSILGLSVTLEFGLWPYDSTTKTFAAAPQGLYTAALRFMTAPPGYPGAYYEGDVKNQATGALAGRLKLGWLSDLYRKVSIEIDTVTGCNPPIVNEAGLGWRDLLKDAGFDVTVIQSETNLTEPSGDSWSDGELHSAMLAHRDAVNLDADWRYHILAVKRLDGTERGEMYDIGSIDSNNVPREGVAVAAKWLIPAGWGEYTGFEFGKAKDAYLRAAVHEIGHAFGLDHPSEDVPPAPMDSTFMCASNSIAAAAVPPVKFPHNIVWRFSDLNNKRLRHLSDLVVRPGGLPFGAYLNPNPPLPVGDQASSLPGVALTLSPLRSEIPVSAPARLNIELANDGEFPIDIPADDVHGLRVTGTVTDAAGVTRSFAPLLVCLDSDKTQTVEPKQSVRASITVLRGGQGALFQTPGLATVSVRTALTPKCNLARVVLTASTTIFVTGSADASHAAAAHRVLATPDVELVMVLGGDHLKDGIEAVGYALKDKTLRPHFAAIEAKRLARPFFGRKADTKKASELIDDGTVLSESERELLVKLGCGAI
jgi:hypothetical protein